MIAIAGLVEHLKSYRICRLLIDQSFRGRITSQTAKNGWRTYV